MANMEQRRNRYINNQKVKQPHVLVKVPPKLPPQPRVFIAIPTGRPKFYALAYMFASLQNLDWYNLEIHFAITNHKYKDNTEFNTAIQKFVDATPMKADVHLHYTYLTKEEGTMPFGPVTKNLALLRALFLDGDCPYFLLLGGDNPPARNTIKRLMKLNADVATATLYQRNGRSGATSPAGFPMMWQTPWTMKDLEKFDLHPEILDEFKITFEESGFLIPMLADKNWKRKKTMRDTVGGSGTMLAKRRVLEHVGYHLPRSGYHSEDVNFFVQAILHNYKVVADLRFHAPHMGPDGRFY
jgi:hypothetical protein